MRPHLNSIQSTILLLAFACCWSHVFASPFLDEWNQNESEQGYGEEGDYPSEYPSGGSAAGSNSFLRAAAGKAFVDPVKKHILDNFVPVVAGEVGKRLDRYQGRFFKTGTPPPEVGADLGSAGQYQQHEQHVYEPHSTAPPNTPTSHTPTAPFSPPAIVSTGSHFDHEQKDNHPYGPSTASLTATHIDNHGRLSPPSHPISSDCPVIPNAVQVRMVEKDCFTASNVKANDVPPSRRRLHNFKPLLGVGAKGACRAPDPTGKKEGHCGLTPGQLRLLPPELGRKYNQAQDHTIVQHDKNSLLVSHTNLLENIPSEGVHCTSGNTGHGQQMFEDECAKLTRAKSGNKLGAMQGERKSFWHPSRTSRTGQHVSAGCVAPTYGSHVLGVCFV